MLDLQQMFFGDSTPVILLEVAIRTAVMYLYLLFLLRTLGARGLAQLSPFEFAIIIALGSAAGDGMFYLDIPLIDCVVVITVVVTIQRAIVWVTNRNETIEKVIEGKPYCLVENGVLNLHNMNKTALSHDEVFMELREHGARHLGQIQYAFLEVNGQPSIFLAPDEMIHPGLAIVPPWEIHRPPEISGDQAVQAAGFYACSNCGNTREFKPDDKPGRCEICEHTLWMSAGTTTVKD